MPNIDKLNEELKDFRGEGLFEQVKSKGVVPITLRLALGTILTNRSSDDPQRSWTLAHAINDASDSINILEHDYQYVITAVREDKFYLDSVRGPVMNILLGAPAIAPPSED